jgi:SWI/SNF-related matrix-associated actin-dependent regulator of chromatin subfamily A3
MGPYDIDTTTYETLMGQLKKHNDPKRTDDTLFSFAWHRIVLDEGSLVVQIYTISADTIQ